MKHEERTQRVAFKIAPDTLRSLRDAAYEEAMPLEMFLAIALETIVDLRTSAKRFHEAELKAEAMGAEAVEDELLAQEARRAVARIDLSMIRADEAGYTQGY